MPRRPPTRYEELWYGEVERAVFYHAQRAQIYMVKVWRTGRSPDELGAKQLISWLWQKILERPPSHVVTKADFKKYCLDQINGRVANLTRARVARISFGLAPVGTRDNHDDDGIMDPIANYPDGHSPDDELMTQDFVNHVTEKAPRLLPLLSLLLQGLSHNTEIADLLGETPTRVAHIKFDLKECMKGYFGQHPKMTR